MIAFAALSIFAGWHLWLHSKIQRRLAAVRGAHEPVTLKELNQYYPEPPARSNAAFVYGQAFAVITNSKSYKVLEKLNELPPDSDPLPPDLRKQMEQAVAENQATLAKLDIAAGITTCRYPIDYASGWNTLLPHLSQLSACSSLQLCQGVIREQRGDINGAIDSLALILRFSASLDCEPDLVSLLTQYKLFRHANELLCWILNHNEVSQVDLNRLQTIFDSSDSTARLQQALVAERCMILDVFNQTPRGMLGIMDPQSEDGLAIIGIYFLKITGKLKQDEIRFLDRMSDCSQTLRLRLPERLSRAVDLREEITREGVRKKFILTGIMVPAFFKGIDRAAQNLARRRLIEIALALESYQLNNRRYPASVTELIPHYLAQIPNDPFSAESIRYTPREHGYTVYSVGPDRVDDGGLKAIRNSPQTETPAGDIIFSVNR